jgi:hypothetical protein
MTGTASRLRWIGAIFCLASGLIIAWIDSRPNWDDTAMTAAALALTAGLGALARVPPWLAGALVAAPLVVAEISGGAGVLLAIPFALGGAGIGALIRHLV